METAKIVAVILWGIVLILIGCSAEIQKRDFCAVASPITIGAKEKLSPETLRQISQHNGRGESLCGWYNGRGK